MWPDPRSLLREIAAMDILRDYTAWTAPDPRDRRHEVEVPRPSTHIRPIHCVLREDTHLCHRRRDRIVDRRGDPDERLFGG